MRKITSKELKIILGKHKKWLNGEEGGERADLRWSDLSGSDLSGSDLRWSNLSGSDLRWSDLRWSNLSGSDLRWSDLRWSNLSGSDLSGSDLRWSDLRGSNLSGSDLSGSDLRWSDLSGSNLSGSKNVPYIPMACPDSGAFVGWKKIIVPGLTVIVKLRIPASAKRSSATSRKCRCEFAKVLAIQNIDGTKATLEEIKNSNYAGATYKVGEIVRPDSFDENRFNECSHGIHFFVNRQEAVDYK